MCFREIYEPDECGWSILQHRLVMIFDVSLIVRHAQLAGTSKELEKSPSYRSRPSDELNKRSLAKPDQS